MRRGDRFTIESKGIECDTGITVDDFIKIIVEKSNFYGVASMTLRDQQPSPDKTMKEVFDIMEPGERLYISIRPFLEVKLHPGLTTVICIYDFEGSKP